VIYLPIPLGVPQCELLVELVKILIPLIQIYMIAIPFYGLEKKKENKL
jgi:hypothetical protein